MELTVSQQDFLRASNRTHNIVESKRIMEVERCVRLEAAEGAVEFRTSSVGRVIVESIPALVSEPGTLVVESVVLNQIARRLPSNTEVALSTRAGTRSDTDGEEDGLDTLENGPEQNRRLRLRAGKAEFWLSLMDPDEFPASPDEQYGGGFPVSGADLKLLLEKTYRAIPASDDARYYLQGVYLHPSAEDGERRLTTVASDSHRLSRMSLPAPEESDNFPGVIIPAETVATLRACIEDDDVLRISTAQNKLRVAGENFAIISQVIDAKFPDYNRVIPRDCDIRLEFERRALATCIGRVTAIAGSESERIHFSVADGVADLSIRSRTGQSEDQIAVIYQGPRSLVHPAGQAPLGCYRADRWRQRRHDDAGPPVRIPGDGAERRWFNGLRYHAAPGLMALAQTSSGTITDLRLTRFRSHFRSRLRCERRMAVVYGPNGSGKTAILEALSMLAPGRGLRGQPDLDAMRRPDNVGWHVQAQLAGSPGPRTFEAEIRPGGRRTVNVDGDRVSRVRLADEIRIAWVTPLHDRLWTDSAEARRRFLDRMAAAFHPDHARSASGYAKAMRERNQLLREIRPDFGWIEAIEARMAEHGSRVSANRVATLERIRRAQGTVPSAFPACGLAMVGGSARAAWERCGEARECLRDEVWREDELRYVLQSGRSQDVAAGRTMEGPHRCDLAGWLVTSGLPLRQASTGEQKGALISIALSCARALSEEPQPAVLLLDEVAAHLDEERRDLLLDEILGLGVQVWMTGADPRAFVSLGREANWFSLSKTGDASQVARVEPVDQEAG